MRKTPLRLVATAAALLCGPLLALPAAYAGTAPGWDPAHSQLIGLGVGGLMASSQPDCDVSGTGVGGGIPTPTTLPLVPNVAKSITATATVTGTAHADPTDKVTMTTTVKGNGRVTQSGGRVTGVDVGFTGSTTVHADKANPLCRVGAEGAAGIAASFTIDRPTVVTVDATSHNMGAVEFTVQPGVTGASGALDPTEDDSVLSLDSSPSSNIHRTTWLPAGTYTVIAAGLVLQLDSTKPSSSGSGQVHVSFGTPGSRIAATGSSRYVTMPAARSCGHGTIRPKITGNKKLAKKIQHVVFTGPHFTDQMVKHPRKGRVVTLKANDTAPVLVNVRVRLRGGKLIDSTASYLQCVSTH